MDEKKKENTTKYGEFVPSFNKWISIDEQKEKAKKLADITFYKKD